MSAKQSRRRKRGASAQPSPTTMVHGKKSSLPSAGMTADDFMLMGYDHGRTWGRRATIHEFETRLARFAGVSHGPLTYDAVASCINNPGYEAYIRERKLGEEPIPEGMESYIRGWFLGAADIVYSNGEAVQ